MAAAGLISLGAAPAFGQAGAIGELRETFPGVQVYERDDRVRTVYGRAMTQGETPHEAADEWIFFHGEVFGSSLDLEEFRDVELRYAPEGKERRVFMYRQEMDGLPVIDSSFRVMTEGQPDSGAAGVVYAAGRVAIRPQGGLPEPAVTAAQALRAAEEHRVGQEMLQWAEADLVAIYDDAPEGNAVAYPAWRIAGMGETAVDAYSFYVHAVTGDVVRYHSNNVHATDEITGTVSGNATPAEEPDLGPDTVDPLTLSCPNDPDSFDLRDILVSAIETGTNLLIDEARSDASGAYVLEVDVDVDVFAELKGPKWFVLDGSDTSTVPKSWGISIDPLPHAGNPVSAPATGVDLEFNPTPTVKWTAFVNAHRMLSTTWEWLDLDENSVPDVPVITHSALGTCNAAFSLPGAATSPWSDGALRFRQGDSTCGDSAYSTFIAHEYGHFLAWHYMGITNLGAFHEGFGDTLALLVFETEIWAKNFKGCSHPSSHGRFPRQPGIDHEYPLCPSTTTCSTGDSFGIHCRGELLSAIWLDMRDEFDSNDTRTLFLDWMTIAQRPGSACDPALDQSADDGTLLELLSVAEDGQIEGVCSVFLARGIEHPDPTPNPCEESAGSFCYADCDGNGALDFWDFLCFQNQFAAGAPDADCDHSETLDFFDFLCFQNAFAAGCP